MMVISIMVYITLTGIMKGIIMGNGMNTSAAIGIIGIIRAANDKRKIAKEVMIGVAKVVIVPMFKGGGRIEIK
jgi:hypothetical protein